MKYYVDITLVEEKLVFFEKKLRSIDEKINYLNKLILNLDWEGDSSILFKDKCYKYLYELEDIRDGLLHYIKIFAQFSDKYNNFYDEMEKEFKKSIDELEGDYYVRD